MLFAHALCQMCAENLLKGPVNTDPKATQQTNFTRNLEYTGNTTTFFIIKEVKETVLDVF